MSAVEIDDRGNPSSVLYYAQRRSRQQRPAADEASILPILEKLRRTEGARPLVDSVPLIPSDETIGAPDARRKALLIAARFAAVTGLCVGAAVVVAFFLQAPQREEPAPQREDRAALPAAQLPKPVQTVAFKSPAMAAETRGQPLRESAQQAAQEAIDGRQVDNTAALPAPLTSWAAAPTALSAAGWSTAEKNSFDETAPAAPISAVERAKEPKHPVRHAASVRRSHHRWPHHHATAAAAQQFKQPAGQTDAQANVAPPPADNSLRSVLQKMFRPD